MLVDILFTVQTSDVLAKLLYDFGIFPTKKRNFGRFVFIFKLNTIGSKIQTRRRVKPLQFVAFARKSYQMLIGFVLSLL